MHRNDLSVVSFAVSLLLCVCWYFWAWQWRAFFSRCQCFASCRLLKTLRMTSKLWNINRGLWTYF